MSVSSLSGGVNSAAVWSHTSTGTIKMHMLVDQSWEYITSIGVNNVQIIIHCIYCFMWNFRFNSSHFIMNHKYITFA